ncbi:MAG: LysE family translocator [Chloroflexi bacterium]|nr:LysE family translocator [Chloroflexota bacterium]
MDLALIVAAAGLGLAYSAAPGAVNTEALRRGLERGFRPVLLVQVGALLGDIAWAVVALVGIGLFLQDRSVQVILGVAGACFLLRLAWSALQQSWRGGLPGAHGQVGRGDFVTGLVFSVANPFGLAFWSGVGGGMALTGDAEPSLTAGLTFLGAFMLGAGAWCLLASLAVGCGRRLVGPGVVRWIGALSGLALGYFGLRLLWETLVTVLERPGTAAGWLRRTVAFAVSLRETRRLVV